MPWLSSLMLALASMTPSHAAPDSLGEVVVRECFGRAPQREAARRTGSSGPPPPAPAPASQSSADLPRSERLLGIIGTRGASSSGAVEDVFADAAGGATLDEALSQVSGVEIAPPRTPKPGPAPEPVRPSEPVADWGGTVYLSNDDSMSLASAQRLLWAVDAGRRFTTSQVRPHELLNYFSFDTAPQAESQLFSVHASAIRSTGDQLSLALSVKGAVPPPQPLDLTLLIDRSCSMGSEGRMDFTKHGLRTMTDQLADGDQVDVVLFDDAVCTPLENYVVGRDDPALLRDVIERMRPKGSTDLNAGLREAYDIVTERPAASRRGRNQRIMVLTDAQLNTGVVDPDVVSEIGAAFDEQKIRLTGVGVGKSFNDEVLNMLTEKGKGAYVFLGSAAVVDRVFGPGFPALVQTIAHDVHFALDLPDSLAMERFYGEEASSVKAAVQPIHYYAGTSQLFLQDLKMRRPRWSDAVSLTITYRDANSGEPATEQFDFLLRDVLAADTHNVNKARALMSWTDLLLAQAMGGEKCGAPALMYAERAAAVPEDVEIAYVSSLVDRQCGAEIERRGAAVSYKVKLDTDVPIAEVALLCGEDQSSQTLKRGESVAMLSGNPGACTLTLQGSVPMLVRVTVPETGAAVRCVVRGGRVDCS